VDIRAERMKIPLKGTGQKVAWGTDSIRIVWLNRTMQLFVTESESWSLDMRRCNHFRNYSVWTVLKSSYSWSQMAPHTLS